ncbi:helix-turn-helix transcriptional regulator [Bacillus sp. FJAT-49736]|nr:helix-turn-helix transcriptional regulator [Bacillus sp. FJAT-49736]
MKSNIGKLIDESPYKREYLKRRYNKTATTISNWCTGRTFPTAPELFDLAHLLGVKVDDLYERGETDEGNYN